MKTSYSDCDVTVVGAGPYGLSAGIYLKSKGYGVRVIGRPMDFWASKMPEGMLLRSPRAASSLGDPQDALTLEAYEADCGIHPESPLPLRTFVDYGLWFRRRLASDLDPGAVTQVRREGQGFEVSLQDGSTLRSRAVVVAAGIGSFQRKPPVFRGLSPEQASHCYEGRAIAELAGKRVAVIGAGQSALESAALLHEAGSTVEIIAAIPQLRWIGQHVWLHKMGPISAALHSKYDVGPVGISRLVSMPQVMYHFPLKLRDKIRVRAVRPAGSRWLPDRLKGVRISAGHTVKTARSRGNEIHLVLDDGSERVVDHVLMGTGYDVDIARYTFLSPDILKNVGRLGGYPALRRGFETSVPGLYILGAPAARSFGPLLYFVAGTKFASEEFVRHLPKRRPALIPAATSQLETSLVRSQASSQ